jgi:hypothetical protein
MGCKFYKKHQSNELGNTENAPKKSKFLYEWLESKPTKIYINTIWTSTFNFQVYASQIKKI